MTLYDTFRARRSARTASKVCQEKGRHDNTCLLHSASMIVARVELNYIMWKLRNFSDQWKKLILLWTRTSNLKVHLTKLWHSKIAKTSFECSTKMFWLFTSFKFMWTRNLNRFSSPNRKLLLNIAGRISSAWYVFHFIMASIMQARCKIQLLSCCTFLYLFWNNS